MDRLTTSPGAASVETAASFCWGGNNGAGGTEGRIGIHNPDAGGPSLEVSSRMREMLGNRLIDAWESQREYDAGDDDNGSSSVHDDNEEREGNG